MFRKNCLYLVLAVIGATSFLSATETEIGVVNFTSCITDSKYGKNEQDQLEKIRQQWISLIEETEKEIKSIADKLEDQEYLDGLSPEAENQMKAKYQTLNEDIVKYQNQLYQVLNQANYFFMQKMTNSISKASETVAKDKKLQLMLNKEAAFYYAPEMDVTKSVIAQMDTNFDNDIKEKKVSEKQENVPVEEKTE